MTPIFVKLADPTHKLPWPYTKGRFFSADGETVDGDDAFWIGLLADGSIVKAAPAAPAPGAAPAAPASSAASAAPAAAAPVAPAAAPIAAPTTPAEASAATAGAAT